jgi:hypothetical protein
MAEKPRRITIQPEDLNSDAVVATVRSFQQAQSVPLVRQIGEEKKSNGGLLTVALFSAAGLFGGLLAWAVIRLSPELEDVQTSNILLSIYIGLSIALALVTVEGARSQSWSKFGLSLSISGPSALLLALIFGFMASTIYGVMVEATWDSIESSGLDPFWDSEAFFDEFQNRNHLNRGVAWSLLGLAAGASVGVASKSIKRVGITAGGGFLGGFLGGFMFDFFDGESVAQATGLAITGLGVGLTVSLLEQVAKSSWLEILEGGMAGKQFIIYQDEISLGSSPSASVTLIKDPSLAAIAARIRKTGSVYRIQATIESGTIIVDGQPGTSFELREGSTVQLGMTLLRFRAKATRVQDVGIVRG